MNHLEQLQKDAHNSLREARVAEMVSTMYNLEAQFGERRGDTLRRTRAMFPTLTDKAEEAEDYDKAYRRLHDYCRCYDLY